jgi:hypothetical protein
MYARAVDDSAGRLRALRHEGWEDLGLAVLTFGLAIAAAQTGSKLAVPLLIGAFGVGALGVRALWRRWDLVDRLAVEDDAYVIPEVLAYASKQGTMERRQTFAALVRSHLPQLQLAAQPCVAAAAEELSELAAELEDPTLALDPVSAIACLRLLSDPDESPLLNTALPREDLRSRVRQIRCGFSPRLQPDQASAGTGSSASLPTLP